MSARDEAVALATQHISVPMGPDGETQRYDCLGCDWTTTDIGSGDARFGEHLADVLAAAGLLRPDPTGEDREAVLGLIKHHVNPAIGSLRRLDRDGGDTTAGFGFLNDAFEAAADAVLASRPRGPVTETPADTITIPRPHVPYGPKHKTEDQADADYLREAARTMEDFYKPFGSNVRATVVKLLRDAAAAVEVRAGEPQ